MNVAFLQDNGINESLVLTDISALLKQNGHTVELFLENNEKGIVKSIGNFNPGLILITWDVGGTPWIEHIGPLLKENFKAPLLYCGSYPTLNPECVQRPYVDFVVQGETEHPVLEIVQALENKQDVTPIQNVSGRYNGYHGNSTPSSNGDYFMNPMRPALPELDTFPMPDRGVYYDKYPYLGRFRLKRFYSGRGCPERCSFCFNEKLLRDYRGRGPYVRKKSIARVMAEIEDVHKKYTLKAIHFSDELFTVRKDWILQFANAYKENFKIPFTFNTTADRLDEDMLAALKEAGCTGIAIGVETGNEKVRLGKLNKRQTNAQLIETSNLLHKHKLKLTTFNMLAFPGETLDEAIDTVMFERELKADNPRVFLYFPVPRTALVDNSIRDGVLPQSYETDQQHEFMTPYLSDSSIKRQYQNLFDLFPVLVKFPIPKNMIKTLIQMPPNPLYKTAQIYRFFKEKTFFNLTLKACVDLFLNTASPLKRTKNFYNTVP